MSWSKFTNLFKWAFTIFFILTGCYLVGSFSILNLLCTLPKTSIEYRINTPQYIRKKPIGFPQFAPQQFEVPHYETLSFPSKTPHTYLSGWFIPISTANPTIIITHNGNKSNPKYLTLAGILHRQKFNVLLMDLQNHGTSSYSHHKTGWGTSEYQDILGAKEWLITQQYNPKTISLFGLSTGATASLIAHTKDPQFEALILDTPITNLTAFTQYVFKQKTNMPLPKWMHFGIQKLGMALYNIGLYSENPMDSTPTLQNRPVLIIHGKNDPLIPFSQSLNLENALALNPKLQTYFHSLPGHTNAMLEDPKTYAQNISAFLKKTHPTIITPSPNMK